jgi:TolB-like protein/AraC-like DNA-binding protein/Tfp pilus assembly protein PilF
MESVKPGNQFKIYRQNHFLQRLISIIEKNLENDRFGVEELAQELSMDRTQVYRKVKKASKKSVSQFIREIRLENAVKLLKKNDLTVAEISYKVGFGSPSYFNKCFHDHFGYAPGEFRERGKDPSIVPKSRLKLIYVVFPGLAGIIIIFLLIHNTFSEKELKLEHSIAIMPFRDMSENKDNQYLCDGIMENLHHNLVAIKDLSVRSINAVKQFQNTKTDNPTTGRKLKVNYILRGSVWTSGDEFQIFVQLIETENDNTLWSRSYKENYSSEKIFDVMDMITAKITDNLKSELSLDEKRRSGIRFTNNIESMEHTFKAEQDSDNFLRYGDAQFKDNALHLFHEALKSDPENTRAMVGIAKLYAGLDQRDSALFYCDKAIYIDPDNAEGYYTKGQIHFNTIDDSLAAVYYHKAIDLAPNHANAYNELGKYYFNQKKEYVKGLIYLDKSLELNADSDPNVFFHIGMCFLQAGEYKKAEQYLMRSILLEKSNWPIHCLSWCYFAQHKFDEAYVFLDTICKEDPSCLGISLRGKIIASIFKRDYVHAGALYTEFLDKGYELTPLWKMYLVPMYFETGQEDEGLSLLNECYLHYRERLKREEKETWHTTLVLTEIYALKNEKDSSLYYLKRAIEFGELWGMQDLYQTDIAYQNLWEEPEFHRLVKRAKKEKAEVRAQIREMEENGELNL